MKDSVQNETQITTANKEETNVSKSKKNTKQNKSRRTKTNVIPRPHLRKVQENEETNLQIHKDKDHKGQGRGMVDSTKKQNIVSINKQIIKQGY